jgi:hypothetical protein
MSSKQPVNYQLVIPANAGTQLSVHAQMGPGIRRDDDPWVQHAPSKHQVHRHPFNIWYSDIRKARIGLRNS